MSRSTHVANGEDALAFLHRSGAYREAPRPDLVLLDLHLPRKGRPSTYYRKSRAARICAPLLVIIFYFFHPGGPDRAKIARNWAPRSSSTSRLPSTALSKPPKRLDVPAALLVSCFMPHMPPWHMPPLFRS